MKIRTIPREISRVMYLAQEEEVLRWIEKPIAAVQPGDPVWKELDPELTDLNRVSDLGRGHTHCSIHTVRPGLTVAWVAEFRLYSMSTDVRAILINESDLARLRENGLDDWNWGEFVDWLKR